MNVLDDLARRLPALPTTRADTDAGREPALATASV